MAVTPSFGWPTPDDTDFVRDGAAAIRALGDAVDGTVAAGFRYAGTRYFTSSGTFAKTDPLGTGDIGLRAVRVRVQAGGGGGRGPVGGGASGTGFPGGGGGGAAIRFFTDIASMDASVTVTRGGGGAGASGATFGANGGTSSFGTVSDAWYTAATGGDGASSEFDGGAGGSGTDGDQLLNGQSGGGGASTNGAFAGGGGDSPFGLGGAQRAFLEARFGIAGTLGGGGGGGVCFAGTGVTRGGGAGGNGIVIVDCFV